MTFLPPPPHIHRIVPDDVGLQVRELPCPPIRCLRCDSCASGQKFACSFLQIPPRDGHPCCSARSSRHQVSKGLSPSSHFPVGFRLPVASARHGAARHAWRTRGRDAGCPAPPAQIRTCALTRTAPTFGSDRGPRGHAVSVRPPVSRFLGSVSDPCFGLADSRRSPALAPATPQRLVTALFAAFIATMPVSDFFAPYIIGLRHHAFPMRSYRLPHRTTRRPPRSRRGVYVRAWGLRRREVRLRLAIAAHPILPSTMRRASAHSEHISFGAQYPAHTRRCRRFTDTLTGIAARLAVNRGSAHPSFQGLSPLPLRQLAWRTSIFILLPHMASIACHELRPWPEQPPLFHFIAGPGRPGPCGNLPSRLRGSR